MQNMLFVMHANKALSSLSAGIFDILGQIRQDNKQRTWPLSVIIATLSIFRGGAQYTKIVHIKLKCTNTTAGSLSSTSDWNMNPLGLSRANIKQYSTVLSLQKNLLLNCWLISWKDNKITIRPTWNLIIPRRHLVPLRQNGGPDWRVQCHWGIKFVEYNFDF